MRDKLGPLPTQVQADLTQTNKHAIMPTNDEIKKELLFNFQNGYTASTGKPLQVDNRSLKDDPFLDAFIAVGSIQRIFSFG